MRALAEATRPADLADMDQRVTLHGIRWKDYEALLGFRHPDDPVRTTYLDGELELMGLSGLHRSSSCRINALLAAFAVERGIELVGALSCSLRSQGLGRGIEPDGCYLLGTSRPAENAVPNIALDVVVTPGGIPRLEVYRGLGVREVWFWRDDQLKFYAGRDHGFEQTERSELLPAFDPTLVGRFMLGSHDDEAVEAFRQVVRVA